MCVSRVGTLCPSLRTPRSPVSHSTTPAECRTLVDVAAVHVCERQGKRAQLYVRSEPMYYTLQTLLPYTRVAYVPDTWLIHREYCSPLSTRCLRPSRNTHDGSSRAISYACVRAHARTHASLRSFLRLLTYTRPNDNFDAFYRPLIPDYPDQRIRPLEIIVTRETRYEISNDNTRPGFWKFSTAKLFAQLVPIC